MALAPRPAVDPIGSFVLAAVVNHRTTDPKAGSLDSAALRTRDSQQRTRSSTHRSTAATTSTAYFFGMLCGVVVCHQPRENKTHDRHWGSSPRHTLGALIGMLVIAACGRNRAPPAPAAKAPAPAAATSARAAEAAGRPNVELFADGADPLAHGHYLVETIAGCGNCHTPHLPDGSLDPRRVLAAHS